MIKLDEFAKQIKTQLKKKKNTKHSMVSYD
jgi:hypothetical protein